MTTTRSPSSPGDTLPAAPLTGELLDAVAYAFSDATTGTMSASVGVGDHTASRARLAQEVGVEAHHIAWMRQVHQDTVVEPGPVSTDPVEPPTADGLVTARPGRALGVLVADCVPVLLACEAGVAAAHSGRAGTVAGIAASVVGRLRSLPNAGTAPVTAIIGPAIGGCCYEVPESLAEEVEAAVPGTAGLTTWGTPSLDLVEGVTRQLRDTGVTDIRRAGGCTRCDGGGRWFSHRASGEVERRPAGRQAGVIVRRIVHDAAGQS
ncbi:polyphenol oxidase family protein [Euzebya tangerina]|uniref:polyphenol oxidase family protein n=1 Tax=Euzebya tangerina TaxID=591198 RepID=UPI000E31F3DA|nr:polyphenol oxidase family protein [Euzebya tangerina]